MLVSGRVQLFQTAKLHPEDPHEKIENRDFQLLERPHLFFRQIFRRRKSSSSHHWEVKLLTLMKSMNPHGKDCFGFRSGSFQVKFGLSLDPQKKTHQIWKDRNSPVFVGTWSLWKFFWVRERSNLENQRWPKSLGKPACCLPECWMAYLLPLKTWKIHPWSLRACPQRERWLPFGSVLVSTLNFQNVVNWRSFSVDNG